MLMKIVFLLLNLEWVNFWKERRKLLFGTSPITLPSLTPKPFPDFEYIDDYPESSQDFFQNIVATADNKYSSFENSGDLKNFEKNCLVVRWVHNIIGFGLFCTVPLPERTIYTRFLGEITDVEPDNNLAFAYYCRKDLYINPEFKSNLARFVNHSCKPNSDSYLCIDTASSALYIVFETREDIPANVELTIDYKWSNFNASCLCGHCNKSN